MVFALEFLIFTLAPLIFKNELLTSIPLEAVLLVILIYIADLRLCSILGLFPMPSVSTPLSSSGTDLLLIVTFTLASDLFTTFVHQLCVSIFLLFLVAFILLADLINSRIDTEK